MNMKKSEAQNNNLSLQAIIAINVIIIATVAVALTSAIIYINIRQNLEEQFSKRVLNLVALAALAQDGDLHSTLIDSGDKNSSSYQKISKENSNILNTDPIIEAIYTMRQDEKKNIYYVVYTGPNKLSGQGSIHPMPGEVVKDATPLLMKEFGTLNVPTIETNQPFNPLGRQVSAYAPFYKADGKTREGIIGIDVNKDALTTSETDILLLMAGIFILLIPLIAIAGWFLSVRVTKPISDMIEMVSSISAENFTQHILTSNDDEIDRLGQAINNMLVKMTTSLSAISYSASENAIKLDEQTKELNKSTSQTEKQASQLRAFALIARAILSIPNLDNLLLRITTSISDTLSFYHVGIFLLDDDKEYAILTSTNSSSGQRLIENNYRLKVGEEGIVGYVAGIARPRISSDADNDSGFLVNSNLPETRSELAVPIKIGLGIIGVLDIHSKEPFAFTDDDIEIFSSLADYISVAIQNSRRFQEIQKTTTESDTLYRNYLRQEWKSFANRHRNPGYIYNISGSKPIAKKIEAVEIQQAIQSGKPIISQEATQNHLSVPIKLRGQVIGILNIQSGSNHAWKEDEIDIATAVADRVGLAIENARLLEDSQSRAARERTIGEITSKIGASINIRNVLQTAVEELGHILPGSDVIIQLKDTKEKET